MADIALIGVGLVGSALAQRFRLGGLTVAGYDVRPESLQGLIPAESARKAAEQAQWIMLSLPDSNAVEGIIREIEPACIGKTIIDTTTGDPERTAALGSRLKLAGIRYADATIAGSSQQVREGTVIVTAGGEAEVVQDCARFFEMFAQDWFHVGPWGSGARIKLVINLVLGLNRAVLAEGLAFAKSVKLDLSSTLEVLRASPAFSRVMETKGPKMIAGDFEPVARLRQHLKDVRLIQEQARRAGQAVPFSDLHATLLAELDAQGFGDLDNSAVIKAFGSD